MSPYAIERCADPGAFYASAEEVLEDRHLSDDEKEYILKSMAVRAELLDESEPFGSAQGEHPTDALAINRALDLLGESHAFDEHDVKPSEASPYEPRIFSKVVAAVSGKGELDRQVVEMAASVVRLSGGEITFVSVLEPVASAAIYSAAAPLGGVIAQPEMPSDDLRVRTEQRTTAVRKVLTGETRSLDRYKLDVRTGQIDDEVLRAAEEQSADLIVIGSHDRSWIEGLFTSETAQRVANFATCPVLIVPEQDSE